MNTFVKNSLVAAATLSAVISFSSQASAGETQEMSVNQPGLGIQTVSIPYAIAELSTDEGRANLHAKIRHAAREVCGPTGLRETGSLTLSSRNRKCYEEAVDAAVSQVSHGQLASTGG